MATSHLSVSVAQSAMASRGSGGRRARTEAFGARRRHWPGAGTPQALPAAVLLLHASRAACLTQPASRKLPKKEAVQTARSARKPSNLGSPFPDDLWSKREGLAPHPRSPRRRCQPDGKEQGCRVRAPALSPAPHAAARRLRSALRRHPRPQVLPLPHAGARVQGVGDRR